MQLDHPASIEDAVNQLAASDGEAKVIAVGTKGDDALRGIADDVLEVPEILEVLTPFLTVLPLQLYAYFVADGKGTDVDQPRNLAKTVTVE